MVRRRSAVQAVPALLESATALPAAFRRVLASVQEEIRALEDRTGQPLSRLHRWALQVRDRRHFNLAIVAVANKLARLVWAVWTRDTAFVAA